MKRQYLLYQVHQFIFSEKPTRELLKKIELTKDQAQSFRKSLPPYLKLFRCTKELPLTNVRLT